MAFSVVKLSGYDGIITDLGTGTLPLAVNLAGSHPPESNCDIVEPGHLYQVETAAGGVCLIQVTAIHKMTPAEMAAF